MPKPSSTEHSRIDRAIAHILAHWKKGETLKEIAALYDVDPGNLDRAFRVRHGITEKAYVDKMRAEYVKSRISQNHILGYEVAAELGFRSDFSFYRWVRRVFGVPFTELTRDIRLFASNDKK